MALAESAPRRRRLRLLIPLLLLVVLLLGGGVAAYFFGLLGPAQSFVQGIIGASTDQAEEFPTAAFVNFDEIVVNLPRDGGKQKFLKISISLEVGSEDHVEHIRVLEPRIRDSFEAFLRELQVREIEGSQGIYRIKEELLARTNLLVAPARVRNVLFRDLLIQ